MPTPNSEDKVQKKNAGQNPKSSKSASRTTKSAKKPTAKSTLDKEETRGENNTTQNDKGQEVLQYTHSEVQQILYLSILGGFMFNTYLVQNDIAEKVQQSNLDKLAENVFKHLTTRADIQALLSSPVVALGFILEASGAINTATEVTPKTDKKATKKTAKK